MLKNVPTLAIVDVHLDENEILKNLGDLFSLFSYLLSLDPGRISLSCATGCARRLSPPGSFKGTFRGLVLDGIKAGLRK